VKLSFGAAKSVTDWFKSEYALSHHRLGIVGAMNQWINSGRSIPSKDSFGNKSISCIDAANIARGKKYVVGTLPSSVDEVTKKALSILEKSHQSGPILEIGGANSTLVTDFLKKNREVILLEPSKPALLALIDRIQDEYLIENAAKRLKIVPKKMEEYKFSTKVDLIVAQSSYPYADPSKFLTVWQKACGSLSQNGLISGNFFLYPEYGDKEVQNALEFSFRFYLGAWLINDFVAKELFFSSNLELLHYEIKEDQDSIEFVAKKREERIYVRREIGIKPFGPTPSLHK